MPIVSISRIQQRYGLGENLPQLSAAEFGWSIDQRRLFIGNGPISEGAPLVGNTEILTENSDILSIVNSYQYRGLAAGYTHQTGVSSASPTIRSLQLKLDDFASVKDFGAVGDGVTDDTDAINRAFFQLFCRESNEETRRSLFFPAGVYVVSNTIKVPTYAKVYGEGKNSSVVRGVNTGTDYILVELADRLQQTGANIGNNGAGVPEYIEILDMSWQNDTEEDVLVIANSKNCRFSYVNFSGDKTTAPSTATADSPATIRLRSTGINQSANIVFDHCDIRNNFLGIEADDEMQNILFNSCLFENLYRGAWIGANIGAGVGPKVMKITNSLFNKVYNSGIYVENIGCFISAFNYFRDVANNLTGSVASAPVIYYELDGNSSINDCFDRTSDATFKRLDFGQGAGYGVIPGKGVYNGYYMEEPGRALVLANNTAAPTSTTLSWSSVNDRAVQIYYTAARFTGSTVADATPGVTTDYRHGTIRLVAGTGTITIVDDFSENNGPIGLTFSAVESGGVYTLRFTSTNVAGKNIIFKYRIERLT